MTPKHYEALPWIIILLCALAVLAFLSWLGWDGWSDLREAKGEPLQTSVYDRKLNRLDRQGVEAAYRSRVALLFQNWMTDTNKESQSCTARPSQCAKDIHRGHDRN